MWHTSIRYAGETRQNEKRYRMTRHAFDDAVRRVGMPDCTRDDL